MSESKPECTEEEKQEFSKKQRHKLSADKGAYNAKLICKPAIKKTIVPVIFIPGIFGSRLENPKGEKNDTCFIWDPNRILSLMNHYAKGVSAIVSERIWKDREIDAKVKRLHNPDAVVMKDHRYEGHKGGNSNEPILKKILGNPTFWRLAEQYDRETRKDNKWEGEDADGKAYWSDEADRIAKEEYQRRSDRGWYGVLDIYDPLLETVHELEDDEFIYTVSAFGYDWRFDLDKAAAKLNDRIAEVLAIKEYPEFGKVTVDYKKVHDKAIIITHSQGSIVARYALTKLGADAKVEAVVHMDQPTTGAPVLYRRFITGSGPERAPFDSLFGFGDNAGDRVFGAILGNSAYHFTRMAAPLTGALSLLPTNDYLSKKGGDQFTWIQTEGKPLEFKKPITDVYDDIYLSEEHGLVNHKRYDSAGVPRPYLEDEFKIVRYETEPYPGDERTIVSAPRYTFNRREFLVENLSTEGFLRLLKEQKNNAEYAIDFSKAETKLLEDRIKLLPRYTLLDAPEDSPYHLDNQRLRPNSGMAKSKLSKAIDDYSILEAKIKDAQFFHADLGLDQHKKTRVVSSRGVNTVTTVSFKLKNGLLECPLVLSKDGDGTVPLTSQEALIDQGEKTGKPAGAVIVGGKHAEICTHKTGKEQVLALLKGEFVAELRTENQVNKT
jgi:hypothetical protein